MRTRRFRTRFVESARLTGVVAWYHTVSSFAIFCEGANEVWRAIYAHAWEFRI